MRKRFSVNEVSDMLFELCKAKTAKAPKNQQQSKYGQTSPASAETHEPSTIAAIATKSAAAGLIALSETASKNLQSDEMVKQPAPSKAAPVQGDNDQNKIPPFHQSINYTEKVNKDYLVVPVSGIPTSVVVPTSPQIEIKREPGFFGSPAKMPASVIKPVPTSSAAIAAALMRDGYHSFQQQLRAQEILKHHVQPPKPGAITNTKILESFLRQTRPTEHEFSDNDGDDEDDSRMNGFDDIHLVEAAGGAHAKNAFNSHSSMPNLFPSASTSASSNAPGDYMSDESQKFMMAQVQAQAQVAALRNLEYSLSDYPGSSGGGNGGSGNEMENGEPIYECRHCGKRYRWKSTLRRHENVECGGKEPSHQCPYCSYRSKQRGNLGVHVRKHHSDLPQLASKRRSKYSQRYETGSERSGSAMGGATSDDSSNKLIIDCNK